MKIPEISVLTSCFNANEFIEESIESILSQSFGNFEFILIDDGSTDDTLDIIRRYAARDKRIRVVTKENSGLQKSLNLGLSLAKGDWIARFDADDVALPDRLERQWQFIKRHRDIILLGGGCLEIDKSGRHIKQHIYPMNHRGLMKRLECLGPFFPHSTAFFSRSRVQDLGGYNPRFRRSQDWDLWLRMARVGLIGCLREPLIKLRKHEKSVTAMNSGRLTEIMGMAATVCHFRRQAGRSDPSQRDPHEWDFFIRWIEERLEEENYFLNKQSWQSLRAHWYGALHTPGRRPALSLLSLLKQYPDIIRFLKARLGTPRIIKRLAKEFPGSNRP